MTSCRTWEAKRRRVRPRRAWRWIAIALAVVAAGIWARQVGTPLGLWAVAVSGTLALIALAIRLTPRWGRPAACRLRGPFLAVALVLIAAAPVNEKDPIGALLQGLGGAVSALQVIAALAGGYIAVLLVRRTRRDERAGHGPTC